MSKKKGKNAIPKRIGGVKVPKALRKSGGRALAMADTPVMKKIIASGLVAAAAAIASAEGGGKASQKAREGLKALTGGAGSDDLAKALGTAFNTAMEHWFGGRIEWHKSDAKALPDAKTQH